ncbi:MAG: hypothetical protein IJU26_05780 [Synergistaceae bacterium]|nr:hypothetical protein [Synergistaceae bacterium]
MGFFSKAASVGSFVKDCPAEIGVAVVSGCSSKGDSVVGKAAKSAANVGAVYSAYEKGRKSGK